MRDSIRRLSSILKRKGLTISTAESCTGGLLAKRLTDIPGSSSYFRFGLVTYSNESKRILLGVRSSTLDRYGAVSKETAFEMLKGLSRIIKTDIAVSITGIAGPDGGSREKPVGTVYFGIRTGEEVAIIKRRFRGDRKGVREGAIKFVVNEIIKRIGG
jgi:nicotinamide-nucleotide amidase